MDVYDQITTKIIEKLEQGIIPWQQPWDVVVGMPRNLLSRRPYHGINMLVLGMAPYASPYWLTYHQALEAGGYVKRGEHGWPIIFFKSTTFPNGEPDENGEVSIRRGRVRRLHTVFNVEQCELPES